MKKRTNSINGLDIQRDYMSIVQYSPEDNSVSRVAIQPFTADHEGYWDQVSSELKSLKGEFKFVNPDIICSLPSEHAIIKRISVERDEPKEDSIIEWEMSQQVIGSIDEYVLDFCEFGAGTAGSDREFLAVAYRNQVVNRLVGVLKGVKLNPLAVDLDVFALLNIFETNYYDRISSPALIIHGETERTKFLLTQNGNYLDFACIDYEHGSMDPQNYAERIESEVLRLIALNGNISGGNVVGIYITGSIFSQPEYIGSFQSRMPGAEVLYPFRKIDCRIGVEEERIKVYAAQLAIAVGLAIRGND